MIGILGVDPGITIGWALLTVPDDKTSPVVSACGADPYDLRIMNLIVNYYRGGLISVVVVEDIVGAGTRSAELVTTIKRAGMFEGLCRFLDIPVTWHVPQLRMHKVREAQTLLAASKFEGKQHAVDALAHALAYYNVHRNGSRVITGTNTTRSPKNGTR
jgi:hypothetical protein